MCLGTPVRKRKRNQIIKSLTKKGYIKVYKVARRRGKIFSSPVWDSTRYKANTIQDSSYVQCQGYTGNSGWHGFLYYKGARNYVNKICLGASKNTSRILVCYVKPEWIIDIGEYQFNGWDTTDVKHLTVRTSKIFFPDFPNHRASIKEFRKALKKEKDNGQSSTEKN